MSVMYSGTMPTVSPKSKSSARKKKAGPAHLPAKASTVQPYREPQRTHPQVLPKAEVLRSALVQKLDKLDAEEMAVVHRVMLELEKQKLWKEISEEADNDYQRGLFDKLPELLEAARASLRQGQ